ncbi:class F sortase [Streptomyces sp. NBC_01216]|uniref:class F sortase n=1 Tax=Streptomyces sp. NBC_01216 TaxID=2903778 RepID=UPI002E10FD7F|nr:class F sortase [Streptomyces sp. NBC_01216]
MTAGDAPAGTGRLVAGVAWALLVLGMWLWGREATEGPGTGPAPAGGDIAAVAPPPGVGLPPAHDPLEPAVPRRVEIPSLGIAAPVLPRGLDETGAVDPPPYELPRSVGWFDRGTRPGADGAALLVGHVDTETRPAVFYSLGSARPGAKVAVSRSDGSVAEFTVDDVRVVPRDRFDAHQVYGQRLPGRAELRLITCGGAFDRAEGAYTANVVVSAYLTGVTRA